MHRNSQSTYNVSQPIIHWIQLSESDTSKSDRYVKLISAFLECLTDCKIYKIV